MIHTHQLWTSLCQKIIVFWYGKPLGKKGQSKASDANNGIGQMWPKSSSSQQDETEEEDDDYDDMQEYIGLFCDKETMPFFKKADHTPPFSEWNDANDLLEAAPDFKKYQRPLKELKSHGRRKGVQMHFCHRNLESFENICEMQCTIVRMWLFKIDTEHLQTNPQSFL